MLQAAKDSVLSSLDPGTLGDSHEHKTLAVLDDLKPYYTGKFARWFQGRLISMPESEAQHPIMKEWFFFYTVHIFDRLKEYPVMMEVLLWLIGNSDETTVMERVITTLCAYECKFQFFEYYQLKFDALWAKVTLALNLVSSVSTAGPVSYRDFNTPSKADITLQLHCTK